MIFVTIGTTEFDALIETMDKLSTELSEPVVMQIGRSRYEPKHCDYFRFVPSLTPYYEQASVVISHGGLGILTEVMNRQLPLIAVEDPNQPDRHQQQILQIWSENKHLVWCQDLGKITSAIIQAKAELDPYQAPECTVHTHIKDYLKQIEPKKVSHTTSKKRVCVIRLSTYFGDMSVQREVATLHDAGYETHVICMDALLSERVEGEVYQRELTVDGIHVHRMPTRRKKQGLVRYMFDYVSFFLLAALKVTQLHVERPFDVIQVNTMPDFLIFVALIPKLMGAKLVVMMQEPVPELWETMRGTPPPKPIKWMEQGALMFANRALTVTQQLKDAYVSRGARADKISVILNVPEMRFLASDDKNPPELPELPELPTGIPTGVSSSDDHFTLICHGAVEKRYGHDTMLGAVSLLRSQIPNLRLKILGAGSYEDEFVAQIKQLGLAEQVQFLGWVTLEQMVQEIQAADVGIVAQKSSPYSNLVQTNKMYEYIAFKKPVLASRLRAVEAYFNSEALQYFEPNNPQSLAEQILYLYKNPNRREALVNNAYELYEHYQWDNQKQIYLSTFEVLVR
ncbi:glycosyltransferase [Anaerolineales bacterium HSG25]|nr:glycosyltransferase [Anaerolineales bacterium HSG25]